MTAAAERRPPIPCMDGIRGWACLFALISHSIRYLLSPVPDLRTYGVGLGKTAIVVFFVLSGFMMMYHYYTDRQLSGRYWLAFLTRRFFRIYPPFAATVILFCFFGYYTKMQWEHIYTYLFALEFNIRTHLWSIPPEIKFYLLFPLLSCALFIAPVRNHWKLCMLTLAWLVFCLARFNSPPTALDGNLKCFLGGMIAAFVYVHYPLNTYLSVRQWNLITCSYIGFLAWFILYLDVPYFRFPNGAALGWVAFMSMVIMLSAPHCAGWAGAIFNNSFVRYCGTISYSLYLMHPLVIFIGIEYFEVGSVGLFIGAWIAYFILGIIMHLCIEKPSNRLGKKLSQKILA